MKSNKGFSLVELIVVIAIMAILVGVAVPVYSSYVEKAQKASDRQLVDEVEHALKIYSQSGATPIKGGYVILKPNKAEAVVSPELNAAMENTFGKDWKKELSLKYDNWSSNANSLITMVANYNPTVVETIAGSSFMGQDITAEGMLEAVGDMLGVASGAIGDSFPEATLRLMGVDDATMTKLRDIYNNDNANFKTATANVLVGVYSGKIDEAYSSDDSDKIASVDNDGLTRVMCFYANAYAYREAMKGTDKAAEAAEFYVAVGEAISEVEDKGLSESGFFAAAGYTVEDKKGIYALSFIGENGEWEALLGVVGKASLYSNYWNAFGKDNSGNNDDALKHMMGAINHVAQDKLAQDITNPDLFADEAIVNQIEAYRYAVQLRDVLTALPSVNANEIVILLLEDGTVFSTIPAGD